MATPPGNRRPLTPGGDGFGELRGGRSTIVWLIVAFLLTAGLWSALGLFEAPGARISYSRFLDEVEEGNVTAVTTRGQKITGTLETPETYTDALGNEEQFTRFVTYLPAFGDEDLLQDLRAAGVEVRAEPESTFPWAMVLIYLLPFLIFLWIGSRLFRRVQSNGRGLFSMGKSRARLFHREEGSTTFDDVAGARGAKYELQEIVEFLKRPERFVRLGGTIPRGALLVGPPGTGKTLLARAVAGEADVPFFSISGSDFMEMLVGVGASRVRDMFAEAKKAAPAIIFIDELDSIGRRRGTGLGGGHDEREQTLNQLLSEMDGFEPTHHVIVMAATNRPDVLDPALLRPGRFDRRITVDLPTVADREAILKIHARNKPLADDVELGKIARATPGFSGADLANLLNEAALLAARREADRIAMEDVEHARDKITMGMERDSLVLEDEEKRLLAYHEAGHALVAALLPHADPLHKISIVPRGRAMGHTMQLPERDKYVYPRDHMLDRLAVMMGGRAAEEIALETATSGAESDLKQATRLARKMVLDWGMSDRLRHMAFHERDENPFLGEELGMRREYSEATAQVIDEEVCRLLQTAYDRARDTLTRRRDALDRLAESLLVEEELTAQRAFAIIGNGADGASPQIPVPGEGDAEHRRSA